MQCVVSQVEQEVECSPRRRWSTISDIDDREAKTRPGRGSTEEDQGAKHRK
jgi:hypothetical protein